MARWLRSKPVLLSVAALLLGWGLVGPPARHDSSALAAAQVQGATSTPTPARATATSTLERLVVRAATPAAEEATATPQRSERSRATQTPAPEPTEAPAPDLPILAPPGAPEPATLTAPYNLTSTSNSQTCAQHLPPSKASLPQGPGLPQPEPNTDLQAIACAAEMAADRLVLVWEWGSDWPAPPNCNGLPCVPNGYRVYRAGSPPTVPPTALAEVWNQDHTMAAIPFPDQLWPPSAGASELEKLEYELQTHPCYFVRAFNIDFGESAESNTFCLWTTARQTIQLAPKYILNGRVAESDTNSMDAASTDDWSNNPDPGIDLGDPYPAPGELLVGFQYLYDTDYYDWLAEVNRAAVWFDLSQVTGPVTAATLKFDLVTTNHWWIDDGTPVQGDSHGSCARELLLGAEDWMSLVGPNTWTYNHWIAGTPYTGLPEMGAIAIDVTQAVAAWQESSRPNQGFVLKGYDESMPEDHNRACQSLYGNVRLEVTGFLNP